MYRVKRFSSLNFTALTEDQYYEALDKGLLSPLDNIATKIGNTGLISIDKKSRNIKAFTSPLKKWGEYKKSKFIRLTKGE